MGWEDKDDELTEAVKKASPCETGDYKTYDKAMGLIGNRHSKYALIDLVNYLLVEMRKTKEQYTIDKAEEKRQRKREKRL